MKKGYWITLSIFFILTIIFGFMWYINASEKNKAREELKNAQIMIDNITTDKEKLVTYITERDNEIKKLQSEYKEKLKDIPKDTCGDQKPSKELLEFFRKNAQ